MGKTNNDGEIWDETVCLCCREQAQFTRSVLDVPTNVPGAYRDMYEIRCEHCKVVYHCDGTLMATQPMLDDETILRVRTVPIVLYSTSVGKGYLAKELPHEKGGG